MNLFPRTLSFLVAFSLFPALAFAGMRVEGKPKVAFFAVGSPGFLDIEGTTSDLTAADDGTLLTFTTKLDTVTTGIGLRDDHMKKHYMETEKFPAVTLTLPKAAVTWPAETGQSTTGTVTGAFGAHGVTKDVAVEYTIRKSKTGFKVSAKFPFDISQHAIAIPSYLGVTVDAAMKTEVSFDLVDAP